MRTDFTTMYTELSSEVSKLLLIFTTVLVIFWVISKWLKYRKIPPGPFGFPILGYLPFLKKDPHLILRNLAKQYGDIFSMNIVISECIVINDYETAKQILTHPATYARPPELAQLVPGRGGFGSYNGQEWQEQRRFCVSAMKNLGMGRGEWETMIHEEASEFIEKIKSWKGKPSNYLTSLELSQAGNNLSLLIGRRLPKDPNHADFKILTKFVDAVIPNTSATSFASNVPFVVIKIAQILNIGGFQTLMQAVTDFTELLRREIKKNMQSMDSAQRPNFVSYYLKEIEKQQENDKSLSFSMDSLIGNMSSLFIGGFDTTKASIHWLLLLMAAHPDVQKKIHKEIDDVVGKDRLIYWDERNNLPYTMAAINEMERWASIVPLLPTRLTTAPITLGDYTIPKGSTIITNAYSIMRDPKYYENPDEFKIERFLKNDGKQLEKQKSYLPFSLGKRNCPGEQVAMMTIFLYFTAIMQKFWISCPEGKSASFEDMGVGIVRHAVPQELCFIER